MIDPKELEGLGHIMAFQKALTGNPPETPKPIDTPALDAAIDMFGRRAQDDPKDSALFGALCGMLLGVLRKQSYERCWSRA